MSGFLFVNWGRKVLAGMSFVSISWVVVHTWGTIFANLPEYSSLYQQIQAHSDRFGVLADQHGMIRDRMRLKHWLCEELARGTVSWQTGLETFSWLNQTAFNPDSDLLATIEPDLVDPLFESILPWACTSDPVESEALICQLFQSFEESRAQLKPVGPACHPEILEKFRQAVANDPRDTKQNYGI